MRTIGDVGEKVRRMGDEQSAEPTRDAAASASARRTPLHDDELARALRSLEGWTGDRNRIQRTVTMPADRLPALLDRVRSAQDELDHHAQIDEQPDGVRFSVWTHSVGAVTGMDIALAERIDAAVTATQPPS